MLVSKQKEQQKLQREKDKDKSTNKEKDETPAKNKDEAGEKSDKGAVAGKSEERPWTAAEQVATD